MENSQFVRLKDLVGQTFTVQSVGPYKYKMWSNADRRMIVRDTYEQGFKKSYPVTTDKGIVDLGSGQLGSLLEAVFRNGTADLNGKTFEVKSNGKEGMDIRYFFNLKAGSDGNATPHSTQTQEQQSPAAPASDDFLPPIDLYDEVM